MKTTKQIAKECGIDRKTILDVVYKLDLKPEKLRTQSNKYSNLYFAK